LLLIGVTLTASGFGFHLSRGYIYAPMAFSAMVESLDMPARKRRIIQPLRENSEPPPAHIKSERSLVQKAPGGRRNKKDMRPIK
jgi:predicted tellurium resistance membrane protein TerC